MRDLHVIVNNKIATYLSRDGSIVCGNSDYRILFAFDSEWDAYEKKVARFIWNDKPMDIVFSGNEVSVPVLSNTEQLLVGVYAGDLATTTSAEIPCILSVRCKHGHAEAEQEDVGGSLQYRLPIATTKDNGKILQVVGGVWAAANVPTGGGSAHLEVTVDDSGMASHSASEINAHIDAGGSVVLNFTGYSNPSYAQLWFRHNGGVLFCTTDVTENSVSQTLFGIDEEKNCTEEYFNFEASGGSNKNITAMKITEGADGSVTMENTFTDGSKETMVLAAGEKPESVTYNGVEIPIEWAVSE